MAQPRSDDEDVQQLRQRIDTMQQTLDDALAQLQRHVTRTKSRDLDLQLAAKIHHSLLPEPVRDDRIQIDVRYLPFEQVGGDYCQVRYFDKDTIYITMCDVAGHGVQGAMLATRVSSEVRHWIREGQRPQNIVQLLNAFILEHFGNTDMYLTFIAARIDLQRREISWSGAGHPNPLLIRADGITIEPLLTQNAMIGIQEDCLDAEPEHTIDLNPGDRLIFHTDGLVETMDSAGEQVGFDGLSRFARVAMGVDVFEMADQILDQVAAHGTSADDTTLIVAGIT